MEGLLSLIITVTRSGVVNRRWRWKSHEVVWSVEVPEGNYIIARVEGG